MITWLVIPKSCKFSIWAYRLFKTSTTCMFGSVNKSRWPSWLAPLGIGVTQTIAAITEVYQLGSHTEICLPESLPGDYAGHAKHNLVFAGSAWHHMDRSDSPFLAETCWNLGRATSFHRLLFYLLEDKIFHLKMPVKAICSITGWYRQLFWSAAWLRPQHRLHHPPSSLVFLILYQSTFFAPASYPLPTHFCDTLLSICTASWDHRTAWARRDLGRSKAQPPAQSRISWEIRPSCSGLDPSGSQKSPVKTAQPLWATSLSHCLPIHMEKKGLKHRGLRQWLSLRRT